MEKDKLSEQSMDFAVQIINPVKYLNLAQRKQKGDLKSPLDFLFKIFDDYVIDIHSAACATH